MIFNIGKIYTVYSKTLQFLFTFIHKRTGVNQAICRPHKYNELLTFILLYYNAYSHYTYIRLFFFSGKNLIYENLSIYFNTIMG